ncbi:aminotransferase class I/II-fold pyridoxal phosphate-dependent enzyme [Labrenzia sp. PHM005]|uniref:aminotransferase class I/II-fold pyridoxal phosphate-dependent enzyme n=1 Tax=Labrenzia sp. PHM005 TaxID=2590016 RepID=UPI00113FDA15|nr:aminotransferase class I/II-fold pyridoxal phosphate-dependent enzyme [Labrenzia sp. PHM005]QDG76373.1 aminotransferase class I/II-fold pyridoxal phosphate-dependent enzyme [Labrenzia sp. PHM005]
MAKAPSPKTSRSFQLKETTWPLEWGRQVGVYMLMKEVRQTSPGRSEIEGYGERINLSSYSYLGLLRHPAIDKAAKDAVDTHSTGGHGVRLLSGTNTLHTQLEQRLADIRGADACITFGSGYNANLSTISALVGPGDYVVSDKFNHASIVDGCLISRAKFLRYNHNDPDHLHERLRQIPQDANVLVVSDGVFSMDGDIMNLPKISEVCKEHGALLMVDEAHSFGVIGETGKGIEEHFGCGADAIDIKMGTLSKAIPSNGGYICASAEIVEYLKHQARGFIFSAAMTPANAAAALAALEVIEKEPERISRLHSNAAKFRDLLTSGGVDTLQSKTAIVPAYCKEDKRAWFLAKHCMEHGVYVHGIPYPVVAKGTARLRCSITANHTADDIARAAEVVCMAFSEVR